MQQQGSGTRYKWHGYGSRVDPNVVGAYIERNQGTNAECDPRLMWERARPADHPLHDLFEWDDTAAAAAHRTEQARRVIRSCKVVQVGDSKPRVAFVHVTRVTPDAVRNGYVSTETAISDPVLRAQVLRDAERQIRGLLDRYRFLKELDPVREAFEASVAELELTVQRAA
jgi:hypothetical protein